MTEGGTVGFVSKDGPENRVFDYRTLRLLVGIIAFLLPIAVVVISATELPSISASYCTNSRDVFVGALCIVGAFLLAYNGHDRRQSLASKFAALAAFGVAGFPVNCDGGPGSYAVYIHYLSALTLFSILTWFCFRFFQEGMKSCTGKAWRRSRTYYACGVAMLLSMLTMGAASALVKLGVLSEEFLDQSGIIFAGEWTALFAFGVAWMVAGKSSRLIADDKDLNHPVRQMLYMKR